MSLERSQVVFVAPQATEPLAFQCVKASGSRWDVRVPIAENEGPPRMLWIGTGAATVDNVYNPYKPGDPATVALDVCTQVGERVQNIEHTACQHIRTALLGDIVNGIIMTASTVDDMINGFLADHADQRSLKCALNEKECSFFDSTGTNVKAFPLSPGCSYTFAIQPSCVWCYRKKIGVKWYIRQVRTHDQICDDDWSI